ncbi:MULTISPECIES: SulP family inorganic anion transporter [Clostridium]|uniref:Sodium-independent anion transporter n=1 Tax=Clostridium cadaveris TaxID=1529 RepID=A0A1I2L0W9_9CLOT|nr:SulP family inorganic anion transporter [Clostridium cadaveris]MDU4950998.1 SulP family inorganic anion transporter [Clostridium sp.]MDM8312442.1 SulP family inorganic anion transporter [Clostridium cadaveris]NME64989.1 STAS domain-containing protein [Clostridium cadaveris]NWK11225.1 STAS domain-containing protein [Clostridium cadaveris]PWL53395.1 MAG: sodium-independent anion transporter [Clostridium cadaveris]
MNDFRPKLWGCMREYTKDQLFKDILAGIIVAVIAFPLSVALAIASGMSPERGLYSAIIGGFFVSFFGGSKVNIGGATAATVMTVFTIIEEFGLVGLAIASIMAGIILIIMGLFKFGQLLKYIPKTITLGFTAAIAMGIFSGQIKGFFGLTMEEIPVKVMDKFAAYFKVIDTINIPTLAIGLLSIAILIIIPKITTKIPNSLAAILITTPLVMAANLDVATIKSVYGNIPSNFPKFQVPEISFELVQALIPSAVTLAFLIAIVSLLACVVTDGLMGEKHNSNQELVAQGIANIFCGFFGAVPVAGAVARASNGVKNGGRTPIAGIVHSVVVTFILLLLMPLAGYIPIPTLSAILIMVAYNMSNIHEFRYMAKHAPKSDFIVLIVTFLSGVLVDLLFAVEIGVVLSALLLMKKMSNTSSVIELKPDWEDEIQSEPLRLKSIPKHTLVFEIEGPMFFATVDEFMSISATSSTKIVILSMRNVPSIDITALRSLEELLKRCKKKSITLIFSGVRELPYEVMRKSGFIEKTGEENFCDNIDEAFVKADVIGEKAIKRNIPKMIVTD